MYLTKQLIFFLLLITNNISEQYQIAPITVYKNSYSKDKTITMIKNNIPKVIDNFLDITVQEKYIGRIIVEKISALLPHVDSIGHNILHANNEFINYILEHDLFNDATKKSIILASIRLAQYGDDAGSHLLQLYYNIVEKCL